MALPKLMWLPLAALFFGSVLLGSVAVPEESVEANIPEPSTEESVASALAEGEAALQNLLGPEVHTLDEMLKPMIREMAKTYGASERELALVAKGVMEKISTMDVATLRDLLSQLGGQGGIDLNNPNLLSDLLSQLKGGGAKGDELLSDLLSQLKGGGAKGEELPSDLVGQLETEAQEGDAI